MPIYEFKCQSCGKITEAWQKVSDPYPTECPHCKTGKLEKLMSSTGFTLKGGGWYVTDFKNKSSASSSTESSSSTPSTPAKKDS